MYQNLKYTSPLDIVFLFNKRENLIDFFSFLIERTQTLSDFSDKETYISPIIFVRKAYTFSIDYNYIIHTIADWSGIEAIRADFIVCDFENETTSSNAMFLIKGIFESFYKLVYFSAKVDTSKFSGGIIRPKARFFNVSVFEKGESYTLILSVPFSRYTLKPLLPRPLFAQMLLLGKSRFQQIAFGQSQFNRLDLKIRKELKKF